MSVYIVRAYVRLREAILSNAELSRKIELLEKRLGDHDKILNSLVNEIKRMIDAPKPKSKKRTIGFILPKTRSRIRILFLLR